MNVTFYEQFPNVIQSDLPPSFWDNVTKYPGFLFWRRPLPQNVDADSNKNDEDAGDCEHCKHPVVKNTNFWHESNLESQQMERIERMLPG